MGLSPPKLPSAMIVKTTELFKISEGTTRTALSRMLKNKELKMIGSSYEIASTKHLQRQLRQVESLRPKYKKWDDKNWILAIVVQSNRNPADRALLRENLKYHKYAELKEGVWLRPDNLEENYIKNHRHLSWFNTVPEEDPNYLVNKLFKLKAWNQTTLVLIDRMNSLSGNLRNGDVTKLKDSFILMAKVLRHVQNDPLLPEELLFESWSGVELRETYFEFDKLFRQVMAQWFLN